MTREEAVALCI